MYLRCRLPSCRCLLLGTVLTVGLYIYAIFVLLWYSLQHQQGHSTRETRGAWRVDSGERVTNQGQEGGNGSDDGLLEQGLYWGDAVRESVPRGFSLAEQKQWVTRIRRQNIVELRDRKCRKCGIKNAFIVTEDGSWLCGRYSTLPITSVVGEVLSFYLSQLLGIDSVPGVVLSELNETLPQWQGVDFHNRSWDSGAVVALLQWIDKLDLPKSRIELPPLILEAYRTQKPVTADTIAKTTANSADLAWLSQWGNLFIFDYLIGHLDRLAYMQERAVQLNKPNEIERHVRNLVQDPNAHKIWFIDNESGFIGGYSQIYTTHKELKEQKDYLNFHQRILKTMCVFDKQVAANVQKLANEINPHLYLENYVLQNEPLLKKLFKRKSLRLLMKFTERLNEIQRWMEHCAGVATNQDDRI